MLFVKFFAKLSVWKATVSLICGASSIVTATRVVIPIIFYIFARFLIGHFFVLLVVSLLIFQGVSAEMS